MTAAPRRTLTLKRSQSDETTPAVEERLHKVLANAGLGSRRLLEQRIQNGEITVNGTPATIGLSVKSGDRVELDGKLLANALHFVRDAEDVLKRLVRHVRGGGRVVIVEYDRRAANPWVPFPIRADRWPALAAAAGLVNARVIARRPSEYVGEFYVGLAETSRER